MEAATGAAAPSGDFERWFSSFMILGSVRFYLLRASPPALYVRQIVGFLDFIFRFKKISLRQAYGDAASEIENFVAGGGGEWDWDDFISTSKPDSFLQSVCDRCDSVYDDFPATENGRYCSDEGFEVLSSIAREVRERLKDLPNEGA